MLNYLQQFESEDIDSDDSFDYDDSDDSDDSEARRRRGRTPVRTAKRGATVPPRVSPGFATRTELTATANRLDAKIVTNSAAIKAVEGRTNTMSTDLGKLKTEVGKLTGGINDVRNMSMLMPLLTTQSTRTVTAATNGILQNDKVVVDTGDSFSKLLPLLMFSGGLGGSSSSSSSGGSSGGGMFGGDSGGIMMVALMMAMQNK